MVASREVIEADDPLIEFQQCLEQVGPDEAGYAGDEPGLRVLREVEAEFFVARHGCSMGRNGGEWGPGLQGGASRPCSRLAALLQGRCGPNAR